MSTKRLVYLVLLVLCCGAFVVDRLFLGEPDSASAESVVPGAAVKRTPRTVKPASVKTTPDARDPSLTWLAKLENRPLTRDVFAPSLEMLSRYEQQRESEAQSASDVPQPGSPELFKEDHELQATLVFPEGSLAVIDGRVLKIGEVIEGFRLVAVHHRRASFQRMGEHDAPRVEMAAPAQ